MFSTNTVNAPVPMTAPARVGSCPTAVAWFSTKRTDTAAAAAAFRKSRFMGGYVTGGLEGRPKGLHYYQACTTTAAVQAGGGLEVHCDVEAEESRVQNRERPQVRGAVHAVAL